MLINRFFFFFNRPATVTCLGTVEAESVAVNPMFSMQFRRPPTIAKFRSGTDRGTRKFWPCPLRLPNIYHENTASSLSLYVTHTGTTNVIITTVIEINTQHICPYC